MADDARTYKVILIGDGAVGKSSFIQRHLTDTFEERYSPTNAFAVQFVEFLTTAGPIKFKVFDTAGQEKRGILNDFYYQDAHGCIIMFDLSSMVTYNNVANWHKELTRICPGIPTVICGNKCELKRKVTAKKLKFPTQKKLKYFDISVKINFHIEDPFLYLAQKLLGDDSLTFLVFPPLQAPDIVIGADELAKLERAREEADAVQAQPPVQDDDL